MTDYALEDIRAFFVRRQWLAGDRPDGTLLEWDEFNDLHTRKLSLPAKRAAFLRAWIDGWNRAKGRS
jgi:hypothetical protein